MFNQCTGVWQKKPTASIDLLLDDCTDQTLHTSSPTIVALAFYVLCLRFRGLWTIECLCNYIYVHMNMPVCLCVKERASMYVSTVCRCRYVQLTSLSLFSYLLAFLPWLFLLSFFRSDWDLSRESCFILCSIWYLLNVAWSRGKIHGNAEKPESCQVAEIMSKMTWLNTDLQFQWNGEYIFLSSNLTHYYILHWFDMC